MKLYLFQWIVVSTVAVLVTLSIAAEPAPAQSNVRIFPNVYIFLAEGGSLFGDLYDSPRPGTPFPLNARVRFVCNYRLDFADVTDGIAVVDPWTSILRVNGVLLKTREIPTHLNLVDSIQSDYWAHHDPKTFYDYLVVSDTLTTLGENVLTCGFGNWGETFYFTVEDTAPLEPGLRTEAAVSRKDGNSSLIQTRPSGAPIWTATPEATIKLDSEIRDPFTFIRPFQGDRRVDRCLLPGEDCGQPAADKFCALQGYWKAFHWLPDDDIEETRWLGRAISGGESRCTGPACDSFESITCQR